MGRDWVKEFGNSVALQISNELDGSLLILLYSLCLHLDDDQFGYVASPCYGKDNSDEKLFIITQKLHDENKVMIAGGKVHMVIS